MRKPIAVFYANLLLFQFDSVAEFHTWRRSMVVGNHEIYNGAVVFAPADTRPWLRMDLTPMLLEDVPKELRTLALLLS